MTDTKQQLEVYKMFFGLIFEAVGEDLDGSSPGDWAKRINNPEAHALAAVIQLRDEYDTLLNEVEL